MCDNNSGIQKGAEIAELLKRCESLREQVIRHFNSMIEDYHPNKFNNKNSLAPIVGTVCDQQINADVAWKIPEHMSEWLKSRGQEFKASVIRRIGKQELQDWLKKHMSDKWPRGMSLQNPERWLDNISNYIIRTCEKIELEYEDEPDNLFMVNNGNLSVPLVYFLLRQFSGIGPKKASMVARDFGRGKSCDWLTSVRERLREKGIEITVKHPQFTEVPIDVHVKRVLKRMGFARYREPQDFQNLARLIYPDNPGLVDDFIWNLGRNVCRTRPKCSDCSLTSICENHKM